jgi:HTH-type transcriptional regulator/antitoxin HigA
MAKNPIPLRSEADYDAALAEIERYFEQEPRPVSPEAGRFDLLKRYEEKHWSLRPEKRPIKNR